MNIDFYAKAVDNDANIQPPVINYRYYKVTDDNGNKYKIKDGADCIIRIMLPKGFEGELHLQFVTPWYWNFSFAVSVISFLLLIMYCIIKNVRKVKGK